MSNNSEIILSANTHPGDSTAVTVVGSKFKGDGYYGRSDGLHTIQYQYAGVTGTLKVDGTLATNPTDDDWFQVHALVLASETGSSVANVTGNLVWLRASIIYTDGTVNKITMNH